MRKSILYTGSYNTPVLTGEGTVYQGNGGGIVVYELDEEKGSLKEICRCSEAQNASWLAFSQDRRTLYAVNELDDYEGTGGGALSAYAVDCQGSLTLLNRLPVMGAAPCHVDHWRRDKAQGKEEGEKGEKRDGKSLHDREMVFTANYNGGNASIFQTAPDGSLEGMTGQIRHTFGREAVPGRDLIRQEKPHVHSAAVCGGYLWITDLGMDEVTVYRLEERQEGSAGEWEMREGSRQENGWKPCHTISFPVGSGPRSIAFGQADADGIRRVYITCELSNEIAVLRWEAQKPCGGISLIQSLSALPEKGQRCVPSSLASAVLSMDGRFLYAGNRGHDSIAVFETETEGRLRPIQWIPSGGRNPRGIQLSPSGRWLLAANQDSDNLVIFQRDAVTGRLVQHGIYHAGAVVCLEFL